MDTFSALADASGITLPAMLRQLIDTGRTGYGADIEVWRTDWKASTLAAQPVLSCVYDLEWIDAKQAGESIAKWLNPAFQHGRRFLPFAQTGAGDAYCLTPLANGDIGVALVWHDRGTSRIEAVSFAAFVYEALVCSAADFSHLLDDDYSPAEAVQCVAANIEALRGYLPEAMRAGLARVLADALPGPDDEAAKMISDETTQAVLALLPEVEDEAFAVVARWECGKR
ncbi:SMI1/KNR4 family protein [Cupriavidus basilensis]|uniref:SMI1/KNR4 family protein n=1 Tax=Cupriavidus basilensis TaxID=68895 RepID=UPI0039F6B50F